MEEIEVNPRECKLGRESYEKILRKCGMFSGITIENILSTVMKLREFDVSNPLVKNIHFSIIENEIDRLCMFCARLLSEDLCTMLGENIETYWSIIEKLEETKIVTRRPYSRYDKVPKNAKNSEEQKERITKIEHNIENTVYIWNRTTAEYGAFCKTIARELFKGKEDSKNKEKRTLFYAPFVPHFVREEKEKNGLKATKPITMEAGKIERYVYTYKKGNRIKRGMEQTLKYYLGENCLDWVKE